MSIYSIKDLEQLSGIKAHTLRIWEQRYDILRPNRTDTNIRTYDDGDLKLVLNIALLKEHGYKISEISKMTPETMSKEVVKISDQQLSYPDQIHALTLSMLDLDEERFEKIINTNTIQYGFETMMINIIYPFLSRIGTLWVTGSIGPAQEHFISNLVRQKIIVAIDGQLATLKPGAKKFLLCLPEGELHELSLLFGNYIIRARQNKVIYLGQSLPFSELLFAYKVHKPDYIFSVITSVPGPDEVQSYVYELSNAFPEAKILLSGYQVVGQDIDCPENVRILIQMKELGGIVAGN
ncbi:DNA-binding transcriptional regulator, MerR family [Pseudarcicella hirudinis]|uniref:DNA-binding transcriptional regulator, MerR family n=1 Tax=Pseudarcicella hirudinis TaxID=1079859 RepID=A0A1I5VWV2_9BACT|nr:MerR family transcriptional regulator [Pseudarcicella hirudinis]SFQ11959.1 DNA-binding transcriptional regulator, MerR family [Pseudarcicella hirudinis]